MRCSPLINIRKTQSVDPARDSSTFDSSLGTNMAGMSPKSSITGTPSYVSSSGVKYPIQNISLPVREQRLSPQPWNQSPEEIVNLDRILTGRGWVERSPIAHHQASPSDTANFDTSMSDNTSEGPKSSGHTPSTNTSYSSPHEENIDHPHTQHRRSHDSTTGLAPTGSTPALFTFSPTEEIQFPITTSPTLQPDNSSMGDRQIWQLGSPNSGSSIPNGLSASSPNSDAVWAQLLDGVLWDGPSTERGNNTVQWTG